MMKTHQSKQKSTPPLGGRVVTLTTIYPIQPYFQITRMHLPIGYYKVSMAQKRQIERWREIIEVFEGYTWTYGCGSAVAVYSTDDLVLNCLQLQPVKLKAPRR